MLLASEQEEVLALESMKEGALTRIKGCVADFPGCFELGEISVVNKLCPPPPR